jgi:chromosome segregation ATPase
MFSVSNIHAAGSYTGGMSTAAVSVDEFQALEQKVLRAVEIVKREREARAAAEAEIASLREQLATQSSLTDETNSELKTFQQERSDIRQRVEKMLEQMDELL